MNKNIDKNFHNCKPL